MIEMIKEMQLNARKASDSVAANLLTTLLGEIARLGSKTPSNEDVIKVLVKMKASIQTVLDNCDKADVRYQNALLELGIVNSLIPESASEDQIKSVVACFKAANSDKKIGEFMVFLSNWAKEQNVLVDKKLASKLFNS